MTNQAVSSSGNPTPGLLGLTNSNRDFTQRKNWGKNIFNNAFPAALACYMHQKGLQPVYLTMDAQGKVVHNNITVSTLFGLDPFSSDVFYAFESDFVPYQPLVVNNLPRADLVIMNQMSSQCISDLEIKLTALPDNSTIDLNDDQYGCELVVRPDTIVYLALSIANAFKNRRDDLAKMTKQIPDISDWTDIEKVSPIIPRMAAILDKFFKQNCSDQKPLVLQPVWKTEGKKLTLHENAFDVFVWSNFAFTRLFFRDAHKVTGRPTRGARSIAWLAKMLVDYANKGKIDGAQVIDRMSFNTKNDKAFAVNGKVTHDYMKCAELTTPRVKRSEVNHIILGGGEEFLSPERRLDAALLNTPGLFATED